MACASMPASCTKRSTRTASTTASRSTRERIPAMSPSVSRTMCCPSSAATSNFRQSAEMIRRRGARLTGPALMALLVAIPAARAAADPLAPTGRWHAYARGEAATPPMGWNSWNAFGSGIDEEKLLASAQVIRATGLQAKGYRYIDLDDGWWLKRRQPDGQIVSRAANFPAAARPEGST